MVDLNPSMMAVGALVAILVALIRAVRDAMILPLWVWILMGSIVIILGILTSVKPLTTVANFLMGALGFTLAYQRVEIQQTFEDGRIFFIVVILLVIAVYLGRTRRAGLSI